MTERALNEHPFGDPDAPTDGPRLAQPSIVDTILDLDAFLSGDIRRAEGIVRIPTRPDLYAVLEELDQELRTLVDPAGRPLAGEEASLADDAPHKTLARRIKDVEADLLASVQVVRMRQVSDEEWTAFTTQWRDALNDPDHKDRTLAFDTMLAMTAVAPRLTTETVAQLRARLPMPVMGELSDKAWSLNTQTGVSVPKSLLSSAVLRQQQPVKN